MKSRDIKYGSDVVVELLQRQQIEYVAYNPGSTIRGIENSLLHCKDASAPKTLLCCHEEIAVAIAHGYAKASGKLMAVLVHSNVGLQHASMAIFNAWCDRVPVFLIGGIGPMDASQRRPWIDWIHTSNHHASIIQDFVKWHDQPQGLEATIESLCRANKIMKTVPMAPVYIGIDSTIQEARVEKKHLFPDIGRISPPNTPQANHSDVDNVAKELVEASFPLIIVDYMGRNKSAISELIKLAELLVIPVLDRGGRYNFPNTHPLCITGAESEMILKADFILCIEVEDISGILGEKQKDTDCKIAHITLDGLFGEQLGC